MGAGDFVAFGLAAGKFIDARHCAVKNGHGKAVVVHAR
jgi:hypothetical protein